MKISSLQASPATVQLLNGCMGLPYWRANTEHLSHHWKFYWTALGQSILMQVNTQQGQLEIPSVTTSTASKTAVHIFWELTWLVPDAVQRLYINYPI